MVEEMYLRQFWDVRQKLSSSNVVKCPSSWVSGLSKDDRLVHFEKMSVAWKEMEGVLTDTGRLHCCSVFGYAIGERTYRAEMELGYDSRLNIHLKVKKVENSIALEPLSIVIDCDL